jgi:hypothetical protein
MSDIKSSPLFKIVFVDNSFFVGGNSYHETKWLDIPKNKSIKRLFYRLPDGNHLCLEKFSKYLHMVEATKDLTGKRKGLETIRYAYIMGLKGNIVTSYRITLYSGQPGKDKFRVGDITRREYKYGTEWYGYPTNSDNWRG